MSALYSPRSTASTADMLNIAVLISGGGSTLDNLIRRIRVHRRFVACFRETKGRIESHSSPGGTVS